MTSLSLTETKRVRWVAALLLILHPFVILRIFPWIPFNCPGPDDLMALGAPLNFDHLKYIIESDRRLDRLPSLLPTYLFYKLLDPMIAHHVQYFFYFYATLIVFYLVINRLVSAEGSLLATIFFGVNLWSLGSYGSFWITRQIILYLLLGILCVLKGLQSEKKLWPYLGSGFFFSSTFFSHFATLPFLYPIPLLFLVGTLIRKELTVKSFFKFVGSFLMGVALCFLFYGAINHIFFHRPFLFYLAQLTMSQSDYSNYLRTFGVVYGTPSNNLIGFALAVSLFALARWRSIEPQKKTISVWFVVSFALYAIFYYIDTFFPKSPIFSFVLWLYYYCRWIIPICAVAILAGLIPTNLNWKWPHFLMFYVGAVLSISPFVLKHLGRAKIFALIPAETTPLMLVGIFIALIGSFLFTKWNRSVALVLGLFLGTLGFVSSSEVSMNGFVDAGYYRRFYEANRFLQQQNARRPIVTWLGVNRHEYGIWYEYKSFCKMWLLEPNYVDNFPVFGTESDTRFDPNKFNHDTDIVIVVDMSADEAVRLGSEALKPYDLTLVESAHKKFGEGEHSYTLIYCRLKSRLNFYKQRIDDLTRVKNALERYHADHHAYPKSQGWDGMNSAWGLNSKDWIPALVPRYIKELPRDPRGTDNIRHQYLYKSDGKDYKLIAHEPEDYWDVKPLYPEHIELVREKIHAYGYGFWTDGAAAWL